MSTFLFPVSINDFLYHSTYVLVINRQKLCVFAEGLFSNLKYNLIKVLQKAKRFRCKYKKSSMVSRRKYTHECHLRQFGSAQETRCAIPAFPHQQHHTFCCKRACVLAKDRSAVGNLTGMWELTKSVVSPSSTMNSDPWMRKCLPM